MFTASRPSSPQLNQRPVRGRAADRWSAADTPWSSSCPRLSPVAPVPSVACASRQPSTSPLPRSSSSRSTPTSNVGPSGPRAVPGFEEHAELGASEDDGLGAAPDKIRDRSVELHPRCRQRNMPWQALRTGRRAHSPGVRLGDQDVHRVVLPQTAEEPDALGHAQVEARSGLRYSRSEESAIEPAIDRERHPGDVAGRVARQEHDRAGELLRCSVPAQRHGQRHSPEGVVH